MFNIFVQVQTFWRTPFACLRSFCHPDRHISGRYFGNLSVYTRYFGLLDAQLVSKLNRFGLGIWNNVRYRTGIRYPVGPVPNPHSTCWIIDNPGNNSEIMEHLVLLKNVIDISYWRLKNGAKCEKCDQLWGCGTDMKIQGASCNNSW